MAKVKQVNSRKNVGKPKETANTPVVPLKSANVQGTGKAEKQTNDFSHITATRKGITRPFKRNIWDNIPVGKDGTRDGWAEVSAKPKDLKQVEGGAGDQTSIDQDLLDARNNHVAVFGTEAGEELDVAGINALIDAKMQEDGLEDFEVTQDFLDQNPDVAEKGVKVGEIIKVAKEV